MTYQPFHLSNTFVALDDRGHARPLPVTPEFWSALEGGQLGEFSRLVSYYDFEADWSSWEKHPAGEEFVCLLEGKVDLLLERDGVESQVRLEEPGAFVLVPTDTWHTAKVHVPSRMVFITPGEGTQHRPAQ